MTLCYPMPPPSSWSLIRLFQSGNIFQHEYSSSDVLSLNKTFDVGSKNKRIQLAKIVDRVEFVFRVQANQFGFN